MSPYFVYNMIKEYIVEEESIVKEYLLKKGISKHLGRKIKLYGEIYINNILSKNYFPLKKGDILRIEYYEKSNNDIIPTFKPLDICYEDEYFLVINKECDVAIQPSSKYYKENLLSYVKKYLGKDSHLVNRLDYATSGLVILSKEGYVHTEFNNLTIIKKYLALVKGHFDEKEGIIDKPIARDNSSFIKRKVCNIGQKAETRYKVIEEYQDSSLIEVTLVTGRCHQIRVHLQSLNHPIVNDKLYGDGDGEMFLHAYYLKFKHFLNDKEIEIIRYPKWYQGGI